ncbi:MAG: 50S ribosomal protein L3 [Phycisphaerales bacterium JB037]
MPIGLMATKVGMTRLYDEAGNIVPVTVLQAGPCVVTQLRTEETDGYSAVQLGFGAMKARNSTIPQIGHDAKAGSAPLRHHREFRVDAKELGEFELGQTIGVEALADLKFVDVVGTNKGKGFQGGMKRYGFKGKEASHGVERKHRSPGSIGGHASWRGGAGGPKKGKRMAGHMGNVRMTIRSLPVVKVDAEKGLILVKGPVPGHNKSMVVVRPAVRLNRSKASASK